MSRSHRSTNEVHAGVGTANKSSASPWNPSPILLVIVILAFVVALHSFNFSTLKMQAPDQKAIFALVIFGAGLTFTLVYSLIRCLPMKIAMSGNTALAERAAIICTRVVGKMGNLSTDHVDAQLEAAQICRLNANFENSIEFCRGALYTLEQRKDHLAEMPTPTTQKGRDLQKLTEAMDRSFSYQPTQAHLTTAWNYFDLGDYTRARESCKRALLEVETVKNDEHRKSTLPKESEKNILTRNLLVANAEINETDAVAQRLNPLAANAHELLGTIASMEKNSKETQKHFDTALSFRSQSKDSLKTWEINFGYACLNLDDDARALSLLEAARESLKNEQDPIAACLLTNLGEAYRRAKDLERAQDCLERSLNMKSKSLPAHHPDIAEAYHYLGRLYANRGDKDRARIYLQKSIDAPSPCVGETHPLIVARKRELSSI